MEITPDSIEFSAPFTSRSTRFMTLENKSPTTLAFKIKTTAPNTYSVRPNCSIIYPGECQSVAVHHQGFTEEPGYDYECKDKFMVLWAPVLNLSKLDKLDDLDTKESDASGNSPKAISASPSDNSLSSNRSSASSTLLALIDDIAGYWRRLEEESYDVINKKKIKVLAHVFSKSHDGVQLSSASSAVTVKEAGTLNLSRRKTKRETLQDVKESLKEVKSASPVLDHNSRTPQVTPFIAPASASFQTQLPPRSISHSQLSAFTSPYAGAPIRADEQLLEVNQRLAILMAELEELRRKPQESEMREVREMSESRQTTPQAIPTAQTTPQVVQTPQVAQASFPPVQTTIPVPASQPVSPATSPVSQLQNTLLASLTPSVAVLGLLCFALVLFSLNASKMGLVIGLAQTSLMAAIVYFVAQKQTQKGPLS
ncbi:Vesicle-associated membrane protein-associated protein [Yarrowia sp. C11]|nr:Vesicle-associated membrane protein-associated protein [Yarrowia sp. E02]KAG5369492.1 Vesicle-associated membrane protein-associated protein [Yarrowia sp. C11]